jgi:hypothetical protein
MDAEADGQWSAVVPSLGRYAERAEAVRCQIMGASFHSIAKTLAVAVRPFRTGEVTPCRGV